MGRNAYGNDMFQSGAVFFLFCFEVTPNQTLWSRPINEIPYDNSYRYF